MKGSVYAYHLFLQSQRNPFHFSDGTVGKSMLTELVPIPSGRNVVDAKKHHAMPQKKKVQ